MIATGGSARCVQAKQSTVDFRLVALFHFENEGVNVTGERQSRNLQKRRSLAGQILIGLFAGYVLRSCRGWAPF